MSKGFSPELGQGLFSNTPWGEFDTPGFVTRGLDDIAERIADHRGVGCLLTDNSGDGEYVNAVFAMRSYCWCDGEGQHPDGCPPNFEHPASGLATQWYKHAHRGASINRQVSKAEWESIRRLCLDSIPEGRCEHDREFKPHPWGEGNPNYADFWECRLCNAYGFGERVQNALPGPDEKCEDCGAQPIEYGHWCIEGQLAFDRMMDEEYGEVEVAPGITLITPNEQEPS